MKNISKKHFLDLFKNESILDPRLFPENDSEVLEMINSARTLGCFQLESPLMRATVQKMQIKKLEEFAIAIAIIRPGVAHTGKRDQYIRRRAGLEPTDYLHPNLKPVLEETYGVPVFQEQVMQIAQTIAGFNFSEADFLRRVMMKAKNNPSAIQELENRFLGGAQKNGLSSEEAIKVWDYLYQFTGFGFNKAHAANYGIISYQTAFLKYHFPIEYMIAVLNNPGVFYSNAVYIEESRRMKIPLLNPDVNFSDIGFRKEGFGIRSGLYPISELNADSQMKIVAERKIKPFSDIFEFLRRTNAGKKETEHLIDCGAFRSICLSEPKLQLMSQSYFNANRSQAKAEFYTKGILKKPYCKKRRIVSELEILGFSVAAHPLTLYKDIIPWHKMITSQEIEAHSDRRIRFTGWYVTTRTHQTKAGERMLFLTLEDLLGTCDIIFFPETFRKNREILRGHGPYTIYGKVHSRLKGEVHIIAEKVYRWMSPKEAFLK